MKDSRCDRIFYRTDKNVRHAFRQLPAPSGRPDKYSDTTQSLPELFKPAPEPSYS